MDIEKNIESDSFGNNILTIDEVKNAKDLEPFPVYVQQWNGNVIVRPLTLTERKSARKCGEFPKRGEDGTISYIYEPEDIHLEAIIRGSVKPKFTRGDKDWLREKKSSGAISTVANAILDASGMGANPVKKPEEI